MQLQIINSCIQSQIEWLHFGQFLLVKLMALQRRWFRHARRDFERFASLGTKRIGTRPYLTSPWVIRCSNTPLCLICFYIYIYILETSHSTLFNCCSNGLGCEVGLPSHLGQGHRKEGCYIQEGYAHDHEEFVHCTTSRHLTICTHTRWQLQT